MSQKGNLGSLADYQRLFYSGLEYALETTTLFGQKPQRSSKRKAVISAPQLVPVAHPTCILVPANRPLCPFPGGQIFMDPSTTRAPNGQGLDIYQPGTPILVLSPNQIFNQRLPACHTQYQSFNTEVQGASSQPQTAAQVPGVTSGVSNSAFLSGPSTMPVKPPAEQPLIIQNILASGSEHQSMYHQVPDNTVFLPTPTFHPNTSASRMPPRALSKRPYPEYLVAESDCQSHAKTAPASQSSDYMSTVTVPPKKAKIEHNEDELDVSTMYELLAESRDLRAAIANGEIRIEENTTVEPSPAMEASTAAESSDEENLAHHSMFASSEEPVDEAQEECKHEKAKPKAQEDKETVTLEEIFNLDMFETRALFEDSFKEVDLNSMCSSYLLHEESPEDDNCLKEILESAEFAELFELTNDDATGITAAPENHTSATEEGLNPAGVDSVDQSDGSDDHYDTTTTISTESLPLPEESLSAVNDEFAELFESLVDSTTTDFDSYSITTEERTSSAGDLVELSESSDDDSSNSSTILPTETHPSAAERASPVDVPEVAPKPRSSMTIEELFLSNRQRVMEQIAKEQDQLVCQEESLEFTPPSKAEVLEDFEETSNVDPFPDYIPDMFFFSATEPTDRLNVTAAALTADCQKENDDVLNVIGQTGQPIIDGMRSPPSPRARVEEPVGHYDTVPRGPLDMMRADGSVYFEEVYRAEGFQYVFDEFKIPGNNIIVDPATLQTPRLPSPGRKRPRSHDNMCQASQSAKKFKVDAGSWVTCSNPNSDSVTSNKPKRCYNNKVRRISRPLPEDH